MKQFFVVVFVLCVIELAYGSKIKLDDEFEFIEPVSFQEHIQATKATLSAATVGVFSATDNANFQTIISTTHTFTDDLAGVKFKGNMWNGGEPTGQFRIKLNNWNYAHNMQLVVFNTSAAGYSYKQVWDLYCGYRTSQVYQTALYGSPGFSLGWHEIIRDGSDDLNFVFSIGSVVFGIQNIKIWIEGEVGDYTYMPEWTYEDLGGSYTQGVDYAENVRDKVFYASKTQFGVNKLSKVSINSFEAAGPVIYPTAESDTGIGFPAPDTVAVYTGGTKVMTIDPNGLDVDGFIFTTDGLHVGVDATNNLLDDASNGSGSTTLYIGNAPISTSFTGVHYHKPKTVMDMGDAVVYNIGGTGQVNIYKSTQPYDKRFAGLYWGLTAWKDSTGEEWVIQGASQPMKAKHPEQPATELTYARSMVFSGDSFEEHTALPMLGAKVCIDNGPPMVGDFLVTATQEGWLMKQGSDIRYNYSAGICGEDIVVDTTDAYIHLLR